MPTHPRTVLSLLDKVNTWRVDHLSADLGMDSGQIAAAVRAEDQMPRYERLFVPGYKPTWRPEYHAYLVALRAHHVWQQHGAPVYSFDAALTAHLLTEARDLSGTSVPPPQLGVEPYVNPVIVFTEPPSMPLANGEFGRLAAMSVFGVNGVFASVERQPTFKLELFEQGLLVGLNEPHEGLGVSMTFLMPDSGIDNALVKLRGLGDDHTSIEQAVAETTAKMRFEGVMPVPGLDPAVTGRRFTDLAARFALVCLDYAHTRPLPRPLPGPPRSKPSPGNPTGKGPTPTIYPYTLPGGGQ